VENKMANAARITAIFGNSDIIDPKYLFRTKVLMHTEEVSSIVNEICEALEITDGERQLLNDDTGVEINIDRFSILFDRANISSQTTAHVDATFEAFAKLQAENLHPTLWIKLILTLE
jgi:hypothetical protein